MNSKQIHYTTPLRYVVSGDINGAVQAVDFGTIEAASIDPEGTRAVPVYKGHVQIQDLLNQQYARILELEATLSLVSKKRVLDNLPSP